ELVQVTGETLVLSGANGADTTVDYSSSTPIRQSSAATVADITAGTCLVASGQRNGQGAVTASVVQISPASGGSCSARPGTANGPRPSASPGRGRARSSVGAVAGTVTGVSGTQVTVQPTSGSPSTLTVPTTVRVSEVEPASAAALQPDQCVRATGNRDSRGAVHATSLTVTPPGPSGSCAGGFGGGQPGAAASATPAARTSGS
ncbi:MAG: hypothetical protein J2O48_11295, partial [Solirubrobacterales bacterium]|nr:hypothetical protein [Solirubrobacterales bacterium]